MKRSFFAFIVLVLLAGCRDRLEDPVGLDEVPRDIPRPVFIGGMLYDSLDNYDAYMNTGSAQRLWFGKEDFIEARTLIRFAISDSSVVNNADSARITITLEGSYQKGINFRVHPVMKNWDEETVAWDRASSDENWETEGGDFDTAVVAQMTFNDEIESFTFHCADFSLLDTLNHGMIFVYALGDTILSIYSGENDANPVTMKVFFADSSVEYTPVDDAFIVNDAYAKEQDEFILGEGHVRRALINFSIDSIPEDVTVNRAFLTFGLKPEKSYYDSITAYIHRITDDWDGENTEYATGLSGEFSVSKDDTLVEVEVTSLLQYWANTRDNNGILIRTKTQSSICARVVLDALCEPTLSVYYTPAPNIGE